MSPSPLKSYLRVPDSKLSELAAWAAVCGKQRRRRLRHRLTRLAAATVLLLGIGLSLWWRAAAPDAVPSAGLKISHSPVAQQLRFADGSQVDLTAGSSVEFVAAKANEQRVRLAGGTVRFSVLHQPGREFIVQAGAVEVVDLGTVFTVAREGSAADRVRVAVISGSVEVRVPGVATRSLQAGESLTAAATAPLPPASPPRLPPPPLSPLPVRAPSAPLAVSPPAAAKPLTTSASLYAKAKLARQSGNFIAEAQALESLCQQFPSDPLAAIGRYELGCLRMDWLGDRSGALSVLQRATARPVETPFRIDAEARIIQLLDELGRSEECSRERAAFLAKRTQSAQRQRVQHRCKGL